MTKLRVNTTVEITLKFHPKTDKEENVREFSEGIFQIDHWDDYVRFAAEQIAKHGPHWIEGVGRATFDYDQEFTENFSYEDAVHFTCDVIDMDTDFVHD